MARVSKSPAEKAAYKAHRARLLREASAELPSFALSFIAFLMSTFSNAQLPIVLGEILDLSSKPITSSTSLISSPSFLPSLSLSSDEVHLLKKAALIFLLGGIGSMFRTSLLNDIEARMIATLRAKLYNKILKGGEKASTTSADGKEILQPIPLASPSTSTTTPSPQTPTVSSSPTALSILHTSTPLSIRSLTKSVSNLLRSTSSTFNGLRMLVSISPQLTVYSLTIVPVVAVSAVLLSKVKSKYKKIEDGFDQTCCHLAEERIQNLPLVTYCASQSRESSLYESSLQASITPSKTASFYDGLFMGSTFLLTGFTLSGIMLFGGRLCREGKLSAGGLTKFCSYTFMFGMGAAGITKGMGEFNTGVTEAGKVFDLMDRCDAVILKENGGVELQVSKFATPDGTCKGEITLQQGMSYTYPGLSSPCLVVPTSITIRSGEIVAIVGPNGSGKSTLLKLVCGLMKPTSEGAITIDDVPIHTLQRDTLRRNVGYVSQECNLLNLSIADNVGYGNWECDQKDITNALEIAGASDFVSKLEDKSKFVVGLNGTRLSGGQRRRLCLARVLCSPSSSSSSSSRRILLLDEPAANLDDDGRRYLEEAISIARAGKVTVLMATHEKRKGEEGGGGGGLELCDRVLRVGEGGVVTVER